MSVAKDFTDLRVWQSCHTLVLLTYKDTKSFPRDELFALVSQMRRAAVSVTSNIAEGFGRFTSKDKEHFYVMASGSLHELKNQYIIANDLGYISTEQLESFQAVFTESIKQLNALLKTHRQTFSGE